MYTCDCDIENKTNKLKHSLYTYLQNNFKKKLK